MPFLDLYTAIIIIHMMLTVSDSKLVMWWAKAILYEILIAAFGIINWTSKVVKGDSNGFG